MVDVRFVMGHHPCVAIAMKAGEDVLKTGTVIDARMTVVLRTGASQIGAQVMPMERTVGLLLTVVPLIEDLRIENPLMEGPQTDSFRTDSPLIAVFQSVDMGIRFPTIAALPLIVAPETRARVSAGLPSIGAPPSIDPQTV